MKNIFIENDSSVQKVYETLLVEPENLSIFSNELAMQIAKELGKKPQCAMDLARKLQENEQKIYYHLRKMISANIVRLERNESRYGMTAKVYSLVSPVISAKLQDGVYKTESKAIQKNHRFLDFMHPFIKDGALNAKIVIGDTNPHGRFDIPSNEGPYVFDFAVFLGNYIEKFSFPFYILDTEMTENDMKENLILIGNPRTNIIIDEINKQKQYFTETGIFSGDKKKIYNSPLTGIIIKDLNPFNKNKKILIIGGAGRRALRGSIIAITQMIDDVMKNYDKNENFVRIIEALDRKGDKKIDAAKILE